MEKVTMVLGATLRNPGELRECDMKRKVSLIMHDYEVFTGMLTEAVENKDEFVHLRRTEGGVEYDMSVPFGRIWAWVYAEGGKG